MECMYSLTILPFTYISNAGNRSDLVSYLLRNKEEVRIELLGLGLYNIIYTCVEQEGQKQHLRAVPKKFAAGLQVGASCGRLVVEKSFQIVVGQFHQLLEGESK